MKTLGQNCADINSLNRLLRMASINGVESAVRIHIDRGDNLNARDSNGFTPLMLAALKNRAGTCRLLLKAGADPNLVNFNGEDALVIATTAQSAEAALVIHEAINSFKPMHLPQPTHRW